MFLGLGGQQKEKKLPRKQEVEEETEGGGETGERSETMPPIFVPDRSVEIIEERGRKGFFWNDRGI